MSEMDNGGTSTSSVDRFLTDLVRNVRGGATATQEDWERVTAVLFADRQRFQPSAVVTNARGEEADPIFMSVASALMEIMEAWAAQNRSEGKPEPRVVLLTSDRHTRNTGLEILYAGDDRIGEWDPLSVGKDDLLSRAAAVLEA